MSDGAAPGELVSHGVTWARVRLAQGLGRAGIASAAVGLVATNAGRVWGSAAQLTGMVLFFASVALLVTSFVVWFRRASWPGGVTIDPEAIHVRRGGKTRRIARAQIASAYTVTRSARDALVSTVELELVGGDLVSFETTDGADAIVDELGFGRGKKRIHIGLGSPARRLYHAMLGMAAYYIGAIAGFPLTLTGYAADWPRIATGVVNAVVMVAAYAFLRTLVRAPEVTIGDDGVLYRAGRKRRFVPGGTITAVEQPSVALPLLLRSAGQKPIAIHGSALDLARRSAAARLVYDRFLGGGAPPEQGAQFARDGRTLAAWREHLRTRTAGYREAASPSDVAAAVLSSARASSEERVGAALALRVAGEPQERIRVAASAVVDDRLREALETIADVDDDVVIDRALRRLG